MIYYIQNDIENKWKNLQLFFLHFSNKTLKNRMLTIKIHVKII